MDYGLYLSLLPIGMLFTLLMFIFVFIADIWGKLFIASIGLFTTICFFIIKSEPMHNFILYLDHSGITNSIYWIIYALSLPILILKNLLWKRIYLKKLGLQQVLLGRLCQN